MKTMTINVKPHKDAKREAFVISVPETVDEAKKEWGEETIKAALFGTSVTVQAQAVYRALRTKKKQAAKDAVKVMEEWKPSDGSRVRLTPTEKVAREIEKMPDGPEKEALLMTLKKAA